MQPLLADHNLRMAIVKGVLRLRGVAFTTAYDEELSSATDPELLEWAAARGIVVVSHDARSMPDFATHAWLRDRLPD